MISQFARVSKRRLPEKIREYRSRRESAKAFADGKMTVGDAAEVYLRKVHTSASLKPRSKDYREMILGFIKRSWPSLLETDVRKVSDCENWFARYQQQYAPTVANNSIGTLRAVFDEAISTGARFNNPVASLSRIKVRQKQLDLPSRDEFLKFVEAIRTAGARQSKDCANLVRFLAYSGVRIGEPRYVTWADANFDRHQLHVRGDPVTSEDESRVTALEQVDLTAAQKLDLRHYPASSVVVFNRDFRNRARGEHRKVKSCLAVHSDLAVRSLATNLTRLLRK